MTGFQTQAIIQLCQAAAQIAYKYYNDPPQELKSDRSVVTAADREIEQFLGQTFDRPEESSYLLGEETIASRPEEYLQMAMQARDCWIVDPIDGTAPYTAHIPTWGISIGHMSRGRIDNGAIYLPEYDQLLITEGEDIVEYSNLKTATPSRKKLHVTIPPLESLLPVGVPQDLAKHGRIDFDNAVFVWCAFVATFHALLHGKLQCYIVSAKLWDVAAALAMLQRTNLFSLGCSSRRKFQWFPLEAGFELAAGAPNRWKLKEKMIIGESADSVEHFLARISWQSATPSMMQEQ